MHSIRAEVTFVFNDWHLLLHSCPTITESFTSCLVKSNYEHNLTGSITRCEPSSKLDRPGCSLKVKRKIEPELNNDVTYTERCFVSQSGLQQVDCSSGGLRSGDQLCKLRIYHLLRLFSLIPWPYVQHLYPSL